LADTVNTHEIFSGHRRYVANFTNESDGTGESAVAKIDISTLTDAEGNVATYSAIDRIEYSVWGFNYVTVEWNHTTPDEIAVLNGQGVKDFSLEGGMADPQTSGGTGDIQFTTDGGADGSGYDITIWLRPKA
jgi:hypothetical protein